MVKMILILKKVCRNSFVKFTTNFISYLKIWKAEAEKQRIL